MGGVFTLADYHSIYEEYLFLGELSHQSSGLSASFAVQGDESGFGKTRWFLGMQYRTLALG